MVINGKSSIGKTRKVGRKNFLKDLYITKTSVKNLIKKPENRGRRLYPNMLQEAISSGRVNNIEGVRIREKDLKQKHYIKGYAPGDDKGFTMRILGPITITDSGEELLPTFGSTGKTKNGHSIIILLEIGSIRMLLGGDLNEPSQEYLLEQYTGLDPHPSNQESIDLLVSEGRKHFEVDVAKACHHGSSHVLDNFLKATNPLVTVISSGGSESHSHPRPDTLGLIGKTSRTNKPLIFSTELARSGNEHIKHPNEVRRELKKRLDEEYKILSDTNASQEEKKKASDRLEKHLSVIQRSVANYGMINVRTDGNKMIVTMRLESERSKSKRWDIYKFHTDHHGRLFYES